MNHRVLLASDLDQTLIYSRRAAGDTPNAELVVVEHLDGAPLSYMTRRAAALLALVHDAGALVPTTTRTVAQYRRITGIADLGPEWAVTSNGGNLLHHGVLDEEWHAGVRARLAARCLPLTEAEALFVDIAGSGNGDRSPAWVRDVRVADDVFVYVLVEPSATPVNIVERLRAQLVPEGWTVSWQGRKLYLVPEVVDKATAVAHVVERTGAVTLVAAGDSLLDRSLLTMADVALRPAHGELHAVAWPQAEVTAASGPAAAEEILSRTLAMLTRTRSPDAAGMQEA